MRCWRTTNWAIALSGLMLLATGPASSAQQRVVAAPTTAPARPAVVAAAAGESPVSLKRGGSGATAVPTSQPASASARLAPPQVGLTRVFSALAIVIALILVLRWIYRRLSSGIGGHRPSQAVRVLGRNVISPRQQVLVLQVGRRVVVVGDSGQQMNPLCEITDAAEVAELVAQLRVERAEPLARKFSTLFGRADAKYDAPPPPMFRPGALAGDESDGGDEGEEPEYPRALPPGAGEDANVVAATREELDGLIDRVRGLSNQFRRS